jgi:hypothetical protein
MGGIARTLLPHVISVKKSPRDAILARSFCRLPVAIYRAARHTRLPTFHTTQQGALMRFPIRPGKLSCAGLVIILMVLPNSIWKGADANEAPVKTKIQRVHKNADSARVGMKLRKVVR